MYKSIFLVSLLTGAAQAQHDMSQMDHGQHDMSQMDHGQHDMSHTDHAHGAMHTNTAGDLLLMQASGTSMNPHSWPMPMLMLMPGSWHLMLMGTGYIVDTQQSGPRGHAKLYGPNWFMVDAEHSAGRGAFMLQLMGSLDPATITNRRYPELFQTGETAYGRPLVDAQHPHDLFMGLGIQYAYPLGENTTFQAYFAPVGDPALGPVAFPHRASASQIPQAPIGHHWQDSTHIANEVVTVGVMHANKIRLEASGFYGREPDEARWNIDHGPIDSWSTRLSLFPTRNWMAQVSVGRIARPEVTEPDDVVRTTASVHYSRPMQGDAWSSSFIWGRNHKTVARRDGDSFLVESVLPVRSRNFLTGRIEVVDKDELFADVPPHWFNSSQSFRIGAYTLGYTREIGSLAHLATGLGGNFTTYSLPDALRPVYGDRPFSVNVYLRVGLR